MIRLSGLTLPLDHAPDAMAPAICVRLRIPPEALRGFEVIRARQRCAQEERDPAGLHSRRRGRR